MEKRREFLKTAGAIAAGGLILPTSCSPEKVAEQTAPPPTSQGQEDRYTDLHT